MLAVKMKRTVKSIGAIIAILITFGIAGSIWIPFWFFLFLSNLLVWGLSDLEPKVSLEDYEEIISTKVKYSSSYLFLPSVIDTEAEATAFFHIPGILQGNDVLGLRQRLPKEKISRLLHDLEQSGRMEISDFGDISVSNCYPDYRIEKSSEENSLGKLSELPEGFRIFLFDSDLEDIQENWNHNLIAYTAVSLSKREVLYCVEQW
ncbi:MULTISPECIES: hypothetical protein [unclassified Oceanobacter]|uniref:hypothetical protein n=1 Tax=unclassified Oceanobacter TaxID=2620260 RepID=UPI002734D08D|nr:MULTISPECIES: hypothetical protein [unclassified Oceanobacter]MDP2607566.1 hypothetical protein [Oceanobacter sp. 1_MG-2023]MDP2610834.1 hypothetical protein [Oceanobacter sp. 2_MG-2023]